MSEEADAGVELVVMEDEQMRNEEAVIGVVLLWISQQS